MNVQVYAALLTLVASPIAFAEPSLEIPVDCDPSKECSVQKYFDHDPGPERMDFACGRLSNDGDTGADFRVPDLPAMEAGVAVLAAADGVVRNIRDGMDDVSVRDIGPEAVAGREAGNAVALRHADGWETQYSHLKKGSVRVKPGDVVKAGDVLGEIGLSGNTEFPHVEFTVRRNGVAIDPFVGAAFTACGDAAKPLWSAAALEKLAYRPVVLLNAGFSPGRAVARAARAGKYRDTALTPDTGALVFWADISGALAGDIETIEIVDAAGREIVGKSAPLKANNISWFSFAGLRKPADGWSAGPYLARYRLERDGALMAEIEKTILVTE